MSVRGIRHTSVRRAQGVIRVHEPVAWDEPGVEDVVWLWLDAFPVVVINWSSSMVRLAAISLTR
jgi:hypothetical protein